MPRLVAQLTKVISSLWICVCSSWCQPQDMIMRWAELLSKSDRGGIPHIRTEMNVRPWPKLEFRTPKGVTDEVTIDEAKRSLAAAYIESLSQFDKDEGNTDLNNSFTITDTLNDISQSIQQSGGYYNLLLCDSTNRVILSRLTHFLLNHPTEYERILRKLNELHTIDLNVDRISIVYREELGMEPEIGGMTQYEALSKLMQHNTKEQDPWSSLSERLANEPTARVLRNLDIPAMTQRLIETARFSKKLLPGLIEYFRVGGSVAGIENLRPSDLRKLLGTEGLARFNFPPLEETILYPDDLKLMLQFKDNWMENRLYKVAVGE